MKKANKIWLSAGAAVLLLLGGLWGYCTFGGVVASADSASDDGVSPFYRVVVRRIPFAGETYEATILFRGQRRIASNTFRSESGRISHVDVKWNSASDFTIRLDGTLVRCRFVPWQSAEWKYGVSE